eukprot:1521669-Amphidinium_carterae.1
MVWFVRKKTKELSMTVPQQLNVLAPLIVGLLPPQVHPDRGQDPFNGGDCQIARAFDPSFLLYSGVERRCHMLQPGYEEVK